MTGTKTGVKEVKKLRISAICLVLAGLSIAGAARAEDVIRIATEGAYPPFNQVEPDGTLSGFDIDIAKAICDNIKAKCEIVKQDWDGMIPGLLARKYDLVVASMTITEDRKKRVDFTHKYYQSPDVFSAKKGSAFTLTKDALAGKSIGVQRGTIHACFVQKMFTDSDVRLYPSQQEAFADLIAGRVNLVFSDAVGTDQQLFKIPEGSNFELVGEPQKDPECLGEGIGIALRKKNDDLREKLNKAIDAIRADGTYAQINAKYFPFDIYGN